MNLSKVTAKYIGQPFEIYGCIELVVNFMRDINRPLPEEVDGITIETYKEMVESNVRAAQVTMLKSFRKIGKPVSTKYPAIGDLLVILQPRNGGLFPAVAVGNGNALASFIKKGVMVFRLDQYNLAVMARRVVVCRR